MMVEFCLFIAHPRIVIVVLITVKFKDAINIISVAESAPAKITMYHPASVRNCNCID